MTSLIRRGILHVPWQPALQQIRCKGGNLLARKPKVKTLHYKKAELLSVLKPIYKDPDEGKPLWELCEKVVSPDEGEPPLSPFETILVRELVNRFKHAKFVGVLAANPMKNIEKLRCEVYFGRKQMTLVQYTKRVVKGALMGSEYENLWPLFVGQTYFLFCAEVTIKDMLKINKNYPQFVILGGYLEGRLLSRSQINAYAALPSLDVARAQLSSLLNSASLHLVRNIESSQNVLVSHLDSRAEELRKSQNAEPNTTAAAASKEEESGETNLAPEPTETKS